MKTILNRIRFNLLVLVIGLPFAVGACTNGQLDAAKVSADTATGTAIAGGLLQLAEQNSTSVSDLVAKGVPFCQKADKTIVAVAAWTGNPVVGMLAGTVPYGALALSVVNASEQGVEDVCSMVEAGAEPVSPPSDVPQADVPVALVPAAAAAAALKPPA